MVVLLLSLLLLLALHGYGFAGLKGFHSSVPIFEDLGNCAS